jgi:hypothetical protein
MVVCHEHHYVRFARTFALRLDKRGGKCAHSSFQQLPSFHGKPHHIEITLMGEWGQDAGGEQHFRDVNPEGIVEIRYSLETTACRTA